MKLITLQLLMCLFVINTFAQKILTTKDLSGEYVYSSGFVGARFTLTEDGKYEYQTFSDCCDSVWREVGSYQPVGNLIHFDILQHTLNKYNLLDPKEKTEALRTLYDYKGEDIKADEIKTTHELQIIRWGERLYLIDKQILYLFAAAVNLGVEPRKSIINNDFLTTNFFLKRGDEVKPIIGKPELSSEWNSYILEFPIKVSITKVVEGKTERKYSIDKGSLDGVKVGMCFIGENAEVEYSNLLWVVSVEEHTAKLQDQSILYPPDYKVGENLTTKSIKKN